MGTEFHDPAQSTNFIEKYHGAPPRVVRTNPRLGGSPAARRARGRRSRGSRDGGLPGRAVELFMVWSAVVKTVAMSIKIRRIAIA